MTNNKILIQNIYYMLAYSFRVLTQSNYSKIATEDFENIHNLFTAILSKGVTQQIKQGLHKEYVGFSEDLSVLRGKLNMPDTIRNRIQNKQKLACDFDELTEDNIFNQILKLTMLSLIRNKNVNSEYKSELKKALLFFENVSDITAGSVNWKTLRYQRNNQSYKMLMNICYLLLSGKLLSTQSGNANLATFLDDQQMHALYENFIREYYRYHYAPAVSVSAAFVDWDVPPDSEGIAFLPNMRTDVTLQAGNRTLIIDAKYYSQTMQHHFDATSFRSAHLYQVYTYVKNFDKNHTGNVSGLLLYAHTTETIQPENNHYVIGGNTIGLTTLDLNCDFAIIKEQLDCIIKEYLIDVIES